MAARTWKIDAALMLARVRGDAPEATRLEKELQEAQAACVHLENPEIRGRCLWCGHGAPHPGPGICKASLDPPRKRAVS